MKQILGNVLGANSFARASDKIKSSTEYAELSKSSAYSLVVNCLSKANI